MDSQPLRPDATVPSFGSYDELIPRTVRVPRKVWFAAAILVFVILCREGGIFDYYLYSFAADTHAHVFLNENGFHSESERLTKTDHTRDAITNTTAKQWGISPPGSQLPALSTDLTKEIEQQLNKETQLSVQVKSVELAGLYWLPLYKSGTCAYRIYIQAVDQDSIAYTGELTGKTDFTFSGVCSVRNLKLAVADEIASRTRQAVKDTFNHR
jgi:hypothetical protein